MKYILIMILLLPAVYSYGQVPPSDTSVLKDVFWRRNDTETIIYTDRVEVSVYDKLKNDLEEKGIIGNKKPNGNDSLQLTDKEQSYVIGQLEKNKRFIWPDSLFYNSRRIELDSIWTYLNKERYGNSEIRNKAALNKDTLLIRKYRDKLTWVCSFTKPIYLRDNSICILYFRKLCGQVEGSQDAVICKKKNGIWEGWIQLSGGDW